MVAMTLMGSAPAAFAQLDVDLTTGDATNVGVANTGGNSIESVVVANQEASNEINVEQENEAENEGGDATAIALAESKGCDKCGGSSGTEAEAEAEGGDVENEIETGDVEQDQTAQTGIGNIRDILIELDILNGGMEVPI